MPQLPATQAAPKILVEFCLMPEGREKLRAFLDANFTKLKSGDRETQQELQNVISDVFPEQSLAEMRRVLRGESEYALLIKNCPERTGFEHQSAPKPEDAYSHHIGKALYKISGCRHLATLPVLRKSHQQNKNNIIGRSIHRDFTEYSSESAQYIIFSAPYNGDHGLTQIINIQGAIASLPPNVQEHIRIRFNSGVEGLDAQEGEYNLRQLAEILRNPSSPQHHRIQSIHRLTDKSQPLEHQWLEAIDRYSTKVDLRPGDLLVVNENGLFHRAHSGDSNMISQIPRSNTYSRFLLHQSGAPVTQR
jgi:hypothetical protein